MSSRKIVTKGAAIRNSHQGVAPMRGATTWSAAAGIGMCQVPLARRDPNSVRVMAKSLSFPLETWVTMHEDLRGGAPYRATFDALVDGLANYVVS